ncbi:MAG: T9SS type A sorting domain-containing protein [Bacteroidota bacterium]|nr:T9SS type A sorting domain-containing protein [Bacteroidota bacterium]
MRRISISFLFLIFTVQAFAQQDTIFRSLSAVQTDDGVLFNFTIRGGNTCSGVVLQRSENGRNFTTIYEIDGVCGGLVTDESYSIIDSFPIINRTALYRLEVGSLGLFSNTISIRFIDYGSDGVTVFPNPCSDQCFVHFSNPGNDDLQVLIFNTTGQLVLEKQLTGTLLVLQTGLLEKGLYFIRVNRQGEEKYSGKLVTY